jgi:CBS domain-containing protein
MNSTVKDVMTQNVICVREALSYKDIVLAMRPYGVSAFPVVDSADRVVGVVSEADLLLKEVGPELATGPGERAKACRCDRT